VRTVGSLPEVWLTLAAAAAFGLAFAVDLLDAWRSGAAAAMEAAEGPGATRAAGWLRGMSVASAMTGLALLTTGIVLRWIGIGHPPIFGSWENAMAASWFLVVGVLVASAVWREWRFVGLGLYPGAVLTIVWGLRFNTNRIDLTISERSLWVDLHVLVAWSAYVVLAMMLCAALLSIARSSEKKRGRSLRLLRALPDAGWTDDLVAASTGWSFVGFTGVIVSGAWYSYLLFGETWRWDTVEVLALVVWLVLGLALHLRLFYGWRGARLAAVLSFGYVGVLAVYWVLALVPYASYHFFELPF